MCMIDAGTTQDNFILPAPPVGGLPISQDWLDRMKLVRDRTIRIILPSGKNILADTMFKISVGYTNLGTRQIQCRLGSRVWPFITPKANMAGYPTQHYVFFWQNLKRHTFVSPTQWVVRCEPSTYQPINRRLRHCAIGPVMTWTTPTF